MVEINIPEKDLAKRIENRQGSRARVPAEENERILNDLFKGVMTQRLGNERRNETFREVQKYVGKVLRDVQSEIADKYRGMFEKLGFVFEDYSPDRASLQ